MSACSPIRVRVTGSLAAMSIAVTSIAAALMVAPNVGVAAGAGAPSGGGETTETVVETQIFRVHCIAVDNALTKRNSLAVATPDEEAYSVGHHLSEPGELIHSQLFEM
jgi:hypothetical protein